jgi:hypothetical protein
MQRVRVWRSSKYRGGDPFQPRNFLTSPSKRGGPGTPGVLLSHKSKEQLHIVQYQPGDGFDTLKMKRRV